MTVHVNEETSTLTVSDLGVTLRTLLAAAADGQRLNNKRDWKVSYKFVKIGMVRVRTETGVKDARHANSARNGDSHTSG